jgi:hypothetical protein
MRTRKRKKGESTDEASGQQGVSGRHHYEYAPAESKEQGKTDAVRSAASIDAHGQAHVQRPPDSGAVKARSVKE